MILRTMRAPRLNQARKASQYLVVIERCKAAGQAHPSRALHGAAEKDHEQPDPPAHNTPQFNSQDWKKLDENPLEKYLSPEYKVDSSLDLTSEDAIPLQIRESVDNYTLFNVPNFWLRDNCRCEKCVNQDTLQKSFDTFSIPSEIKPKNAVIEKDGLRVTWDHNDHQSFYEWGWLFAHRSSLKMTRLDRDRLEKGRGMICTFWSEKATPKPPSVHYASIMGGDLGVAEWTNKIRVFGFCYVDGCPISPKKTKKLLERIAFIRTTHYGGFYDFTSDLTMKDTAYTSLALGAHTDNTYFTDPAGLQMFHLLSHTEGEGGASLLVDGFKAAKTLERESIAAYRTLLTTPVTWHASGNEGITITPAKKYPVFNSGPYFRNAPRGLTDSRNSTPSLMQIRWNNDDRGPVDMRGAEDWYAAARKFDEILKRPESQYWAQLEPGRPLIFDNWRFLHGRSAFTGKRRMCGGYINHDDFISRWRNTNYSRKEILGQIL